MSRRVSISVSLRIDSSPYQTIIEKDVELDGTVKGFEELVREAMGRARDLMERK